MSGEVGRIIGEGAKTRYLIDGKEVSKRTFDKHFPDKPIGMFGGQQSGTWPLTSEAAAVHPSQIPEARAAAAAAGVPTNFDPETGGPIFTDRAHRRRYLRAHGNYDRDGGYGDG